MERADILIEIVQGQDMQWCISEVNKRTQKKREEEKKRQIDRNIDILSSPVQSLMVHYL